MLGCDMSWLNSTKFLTEEEDASFKKQISSESNKYTLILLILRTYGMRQGELLNVRAKDVNLKTQTIKIHGTKGSNSRELPLSPDIMKRLKPEVEALPSGELKVFDICARHLRRKWAWYRPVKKGLHSLRHTAAISIYRQTKDIQMVKQILGHRSLMTTLIYQEFCYQQEEFKKVFLG